MITPILALDNPYQTAQRLQQAGWTIDFSNPPESGDPIVGVSLQGNELLLGVTQGFVDNESLAYRGCGVCFYLTVAKDRLEQIRLDHAAFEPGPLQTQAWGCNFQLNIEGYRFMVSAGV